MREVDFSRAVQVGQFRAIDFFGDGSFYILDTPGHAIGHLGALARTTTAPDTFIFMGGDLCHHSGEIRPSKYLPIPRGLSPSRPAAASFPCPGSALYDQLQASRDRSSDQPFFDPGMGLDIKETLVTIGEAQKADARDNIWFVYAHDPSLIDTVSLFPMAANEWKKSGWREKTLWVFLQDFAPAVEALQT